MTLNSRQKGKRGASNYASGVRYERKSKRRLEADGFTCTRSSSSKGLWDVTAVNVHGTRLIQVKGGNRKPSERELGPFALLAVHPSTSKEVWYWKSGARDPIIKTIGGP